MESFNKRCLDAYLAGFVDADGSISIKSTSKIKGHTVSLSVHNCNEVAVQMFVDRFGGGKLRSKLTGKAKYNSNWRPCWEWTLTCKKAAKAIKALYPFLVVKKRQAELAMQLDDMKSKSNGMLARWQPQKWKEVLKEYDFLKGECKKLNKRGRDR